MSKPPKQQSKALSLDDQDFTCLPLDMPLSHVLEVTDKCWTLDRLWPAEDCAKQIGMLHQVLEQCRTRGILTLGDAIKNSDSVIDLAFDIATPTTDGGTVTIGGAVTSPGIRHERRNLVLAALITAVASRGVDPTPIARVWPRVGHRTDNPRRPCELDEIILFRVVRWWQLHHGGDRVLNSALSYVLMDAGVLAGEVYDVYINHLGPTRTDPTEINCPGLVGLQRPNGRADYQPPPPLVATRVLNLDPFHQECFRTGMPRRIALKGEHTLLASDGAHDPRDREDILAARQALAAEGSPYDSKVRKYVYRAQANIGGQMNNLIAMLGVSPEITPYSVHTWRAKMFWDARDAEEAMHVTGRSFERTRRLLRDGERGRIDPAVTSLSAWNMDSTPSRGAAGTGEAGDLSAA